MLWGLDRCGLLHEDEPRYAWIGREMAWSGDWVTPRLWGEPWFEKPALLYWMIATATKAGLRDELAARVPVALASLLFLYYYWRVLAREFSGAAAWYATAMLGTSAGWIAYSHVAVTDLPMSAAFGAAMLAGMPWLARGEDRGGLKIAGVLLGVAVLGKALVPLALAAPAVWMARRRWRELIVPGLLCLAVAGPWYVACWAVNGRAFTDELFWRHHVERMTSGEAIRHVQRWWFYGPVLLAGMFPWTPLIGLSVWRGVRSDVRLQLLAGWAGFGLVFFSIWTNKLPGYLLPLMPAVFALIGVRLSEPTTRARWLPVCAGLAGLVPLVGVVLPKALDVGISRVDLKALPWGYVGIGFVLYFCVWACQRWRGTGWAAGLVAALCVGGVVYMKVTVLPVLDREVSARGMWGRNELNYRYVLEI